MGKALRITGPKKLEFIEYEEPALRPGEVRVETLYSGISAGTQLTLYRGKNPYIQKQWDNDLRLFIDRAEETSAYPITGMWGYEEVGRVAEVGAEVDQVKVGDVVYGTWGHRSTQILPADVAADHLLIGGAGTAGGVDPIVGIYSQMGPIALNAVLDAGIHIGETVAVYGLGVPGQIVAQLARLNGAYVVGVDLDAGRRKTAEKLGAMRTFDPAACDAALEIKKLTHGGADKCIEISGSPAALQQAIRSAAFQGRVICSGFMPMPAAALCLGEEFHHNRIQIVCSQISDLGLTLKNTWDRLRMEKTVMRLCAEGRLDLKALITDVVPFAEAEAAYHMLDTSTDCLQVVLRF